MAEYEKIQKGLAERIIQMSEAELKHRQQAERDDLEHKHSLQINEQKLQHQEIQFNQKTMHRRLFTGQVFAMISVLVFSVGGFVLIFNGYTKSGIVFVGSTLTAIVWAFLDYRHTSKKEIQAMDEEFSKQSDSDK
jgi:uncharacterized membrane protein